MQREATNIEKRVLVIMFTLYSGFNSLIGALFVEYCYGFQPSNKSHISLILFVFSSSIILSVIFFQEWYLCTVKESKDQKRILPIVWIVLLTAFLVVETRLVTGNPSWKTAIISILRAFLYIFLYHGLEQAVKDTSIDCSRRRIRLMIPWIYGILEPAMFGAAVILTLFGGRVAFTLYCIPILYYFIWKFSLKSDTRDVKIINGLVCILIVGALSLLYYLIILKPGDYHISYTVTVKTLSLTVCALGIFGIPGLIEMAQVLRHDGIRQSEEQNNKDKTTYAEIMQIMSVVDLFSVVIIHSAFVYIDIPFIYFGVYAVLSLLWVLIARAHYEGKRENPYNGSYILSVLYPVIPSICVLSCIFDIIPRPQIELQINPEIAYFSAVFHFVADAIAITGFGVKLRISEIAQNAWRIRLIGHRTLGLFLSEMLFLFASLLGVGSKRTSVMMLLLTGEMLLQCLIYILFYSTKRFQEQ